MWPAMGIEHQTWFWPWVLHPIHSATCFHVHAYTNSCLCLKRRYSLNFTCKLFICLLATLVLTRCSFKATCQLFHYYFWFKQYLFRDNWETIQVLYYFWVEHPSKYHRWSAISSSLVSIHVCIHVFMHVCIYSWLWRHRPTRPLKSSSGLIGLLR